MSRERTIMFKYKYSPINNQYKFVQMFHLDYSPEWAYDGENLVGLSRYILRAIVVNLTNRGFKVIKSWYQKLFRVRLKDHIIILKMTENEKSIH